MLDEDSTPTQNAAEQGGAVRGGSRPRRRAAGRPAGPPAPVSDDIFAVPGSREADKPAAAAKDEPAAAPTPDPAPAPDPAPVDDTVEVEQPEVEVEDDLTDEVSGTDETDAEEADDDSAEVSVPGIGGLLFQAPPSTPAPALRRAQRDAVESDDDDEDDDETPARSGGNRGGGNRGRGARDADDRDDADQDTDADDSDDSDDDTDEDGNANKRRRRSRGGRRRRKSGGGQQGNDDESGSDESDEADDDADDSGEESGNGGTTRRRRSRRRAGDSSGTTGDDPENTVVRVREGRTAEDEITGVTGSTRLEAKKQRRREGREAGRRRAPIVSEAEFLARREAVDRQMIVRQHTGSSDGDTYTQIAVLEDKVLVEHYVARESQTSLIGNVYLGKVQNVLPSMEAAFVDIGAGRNAVLYAGEVDWSTLGNSKARKIEDALTPGQTVLVQVSKDPIGQKGARLTSQISLPGRFLVYVPGGQNNGISRKLPDTERSRLKHLLKEVLPEDAGVIVRTAAEGASEDQLTRDVTSLKARWDDIERKVAAGRAPELLYAEPDLVIKVVRDLFNEDFSTLVVEGRDAWDNISSYVGHVASDLAERLTLWEPSDDTASDVFAEYRVDEQIHKALDRKVWLPSGGSLVIDRTEAMTVVDVNTGKFTGTGGNLEETVTKNNLEAAEEIVRQLRLRDIGGIIVIDFIDMVLESNRDLVLRRLVECLGRDRTRHQVAEVTSLGLVQMTRKRIGTGLLESFSTECEHCKGRGVQLHAEPIEPKKDDGRRGRGARGGRGGQAGGNGNGNGQQGGNGQQSKNGGNGGSNGNGNNGSSGNGNGNGGGNGRGRGRGGNAKDAPTDEQPDTTPDAPEETAAAPQEQHQPAEHDPAQHETPAPDPTGEPAVAGEVPPPPAADETPAEADPAPEEPSPDAASGTDEAPVLTDEGQAP
ncbi:Rne/Rng family ribonuclease [Aeromicrobium sp. Leaf350]|uniref:Rne/Rng family ribonuclease n=1 Tax=Aeromicrobium sp. Leaf350 TaxID=2876565 RepID=UPI001E4B8CA3|nr:Rne/Rng family ribonuclease [Aeromicrobium sp. Leaf350]